MQDHLTNFVEAMAALDCAPAHAGDIIADDRWHAVRLAQDSPKEKKGYYRLKIDGDFAVGNFGSHRIGETHNWHSKIPSSKKISPEERKAFKQKIEEDRLIKEADRIKKEEKARVAAKRVWDGSSLADPTHPYLVRKKMGSHGFRQSDGLLLIPMWADRVFQSYQSIDENGDKLYLEGARKKGCYCPLMEKGESLDTILFAEGVATADSIRAATGLPTIICFDAGNILPVLEDFKARYPQSRLVICADNDQWQKLKPTDTERFPVGTLDKRNVGIHKAQQAAAHLGGLTVIWPDIPDDDPGRRTDFNDIACSDGLEAVSRHLNTALSQTPAPPIKDENRLPVSLPSTQQTSAPNPHANWLTLCVEKYNSKGEPVGPDPSRSINYNIFAYHHPELRGVFQWDEFQLCVIVAKRPPWTPLDKFLVHKLQDNDIFECDYMMQRLGMSGSFNYTRAAIYTAASKNAVHPPRDYFNSLEWDKVPRIDEWLIDHAGATQDDPMYVRAVFRTWMLGAVKRVYEPGCKFDHMLILEGAQGKYKSTFLKELSTLGSDGYQESYFTDTFQLKNAENKDELSKLKGVLIVEIQEMASFGKKDRDTLTAFVTTTEDEYRKPYGFENAKYPRQFVLAGTYNPVSGLFSDPTGTRRYWCVAVQQIDINRLRKEREQLWAEAVHRYKSGESLVLSEELYATAERVQQSRYIEDDWTSDVLNFALGRQFFEVREILHHLGIERSRQTRTENLRVCNILKRHGYERRQRKMGGRNISTWEPPPYDQSASNGIVEQEILF